MAHWPSEGFEDASYDFQIIIYPNGEVNINMRTIGGQYSATVGMQNESGTIASQVDEYNGIMPDMGYFEFIPAILGDINQDNFINIFDIVILVEHVMDDIYLEEGDLNQDESMNVMDVIILVNLILNL